MAELGLSQSHLAALVNTLASIDQRLSRIEATLNISAPPPNTSVSHPAHNPAVAEPVPAPSLVPQPHPQQPGPASARPGGVLLNPTNKFAPVSPAIQTTPGPGTTTTTFTPLEPPPAGYTISSRATMQDELDQFTLPRGYSMRIAGAKVTGKRKVRWVCFRGGTARIQQQSHHDQQQQQQQQQQQRAAGPEGTPNSGQPGRRRPRRKATTERASKKCGCPFRFEAVETARDSDVWVLHYPNAEHRAHNHGPSDTASDPRARRLPAYVLAEVDGWLRAGWLVSRIQEELRSRGFVNVLNTDLYNRKRLLKKEEEAHAQLTG